MQSNSIVTYTPFLDSLGCFPQHFRNHQLYSPIQIVKHFMDVWICVVLVVMLMPVDSRATWDGIHINVLLA